MSGQVVPAAVGRSGRENAGQVRVDREDGECTVGVVGVGEGDGHDITDVQGVADCIGARGNDADWGRLFVGCRGRGERRVAGVTVWGGQGGVSMGGG